MTTTVYHKKMEGARMMIENPWIAEQERHDDECEAWDRLHNHWEHDADNEAIMDFALDVEITYKALALWLNADESEIEIDNAVVCFDYLPQEKQRELVIRYIEYTSMQDRFNEWFEDRYSDKF